MENRQTPEDVSRLIRGSMRPYDEPAAATAGGGGGETSARPGRAAKLKGLLTGENLLNVVCVLFALVFLGLAFNSVTSAGNVGALLSTDTLFFIVVSLMLAGLFLVNPALTLRQKGMLKNPFAAGDAAPVVEEGPIHFEGSTPMFLKVLGGLLLLTLVEVALAYFEVRPAVMLAIVMGLSLVKAGLIMGYFMHLRFERMSLVLTLVPALVVCICLLFVFFPDSFRLNKLRPEQTGQPATMTNAPPH
jgi:caa(3)-type oxidase subunit IV